MPGAKLKHPSQHTPHPTRRRRKATALLQQPPRLRKHPTHRGVPIGLHELAALPHQRSCEPVRGGVGLPAEPIPAWSTTLTTLYRWGVVLLDPSDGTSGLPRPVASGTGDAGQRPSPSSGTPHDQRRRVRNGTPRA